jgi:hypothetical protein
MPRVDAPIAGRDVAQYHGREVRSANRPTVATVSRSLLVTAVATFLIYRKASGAIGREI